MMRTKNLGVNLTLSAAVAGMVMLVGATVLAKKTDICKEDKYHNKLCAHIEKVAKDPKHAGHYDITVKFVAHCGSDAKGCSLDYHLHGANHHITDLAHDKTVTKTMVIEDVDPAKSKDGHHDLDIDLKPKTANHGHIELDVVYDNGHFHFVEHH